MNPLLQESEELLKKYNFLEKIGASEYKNSNQVLSKLFSRNNSDIASPYLSNPNADSIEDLSRVKAE